MEILETLLKNTPPPPKELEHLMENSEGDWYVETNLCIPRGYLFD